MTTAKEYIQNTFEAVKARNAHEAEFLQAVEEFLNTLEPVFEKHPEYKQDYLKEKILFAEFNKLLKQEKYLNLSLSELLEIAHSNIQQ